MPFGLLFVFIIYHIQESGRACYGMTRLLVLEIVIHCTLWWTNRLVRRNSLACGRQAVGRRGLDSKDGCF